MQPISLNNGAEIWTYLEKQLQDLSIRMTLKKHEKYNLKKLFRNAYQKELVSEGSKNNTFPIFIEPTSESKRLTNFFMKRLLPSWTIKGEENLLKAFDHHLKGGRVIFMLNHTNLADSPIFDYLLDNFLKNNYSRTKIKHLKKAMVWIASIRAYGNPFVSMFSKCSNIATVFNRRNINQAQQKAQEAQEESEKETWQQKFSAMLGHNINAIKAVAKYRFIPLIFIEGTCRYVNLLHRGDPAAANIPKLINATKEGCDNTLIVTCFLEGVGKALDSSVLTDVEDKLYHFLEVFNLNNDGCLHIGEPILWNEIVSSVPRQERVEHEQLLVDYIMGKLMAPLAPESARGYYSSYN